MVDFEYTIFTKGKSHLYDLALGVKDQNNFNKLVTCWPKFKFDGLNKYQIESNFHIYFLHHFFPKLNLEKKLLKYIFSNGKLLNKAVVDINLAKFLYPRSEKIYLDYPTNSYEYQKKQWEFEEEYTGFSIDRLKRLKQSFNDVEMIKIQDNAHKIIVPSVTSLNTFNLSLKSKLCYIPFWLPKIENVFEEVKYRELKDISISFIGIICPSKGIHYLIKALNLINFNGILNLYGSIVNYDYSLSLKNMSKGYQIIFHGKLSQLELYKHIRNSNLAVMPSVSEGLPLSYLQALSIGIPVIASYDSSLIEVIGEENIYETKNIEELAIKLENFFLNKNYFIDMKKVRANYTLEKYIENWKKILNE